MTDPLRAMLDMEARRGARPVLIGEGMFEEFAARTLDGNRVTVNWGQPDEFGFYTPWFRSDATDNLVISERRRIAAEVNALPGECHDGEGLGCETHPCAENVSRDAVLAVVLAVKTRP